MRNSRGSGRAAADTNALLGPEEDKSTTTLEATAVPYPVIDMPRVSPLSFALLLRRWRALREVPFAGRGAVELVIQQASIHALSPWLA